MTDALSDDYLAWCRQERAAPNTIASRARTLRSLGNAGTATREDVEAWWRTRADLAPSTRALDLSNLRAFYKWAARWERRADDPTLRLDPPRVSRGLPRPITSTDLTTILAAVTDDLRRAVALGAYAGLRIAESAALRWDDVDDETATLVVRAGKGGKSRRVAVGSVLRDVLGARVRGAYVVTGEDWTMTGAALQRKLNRAMRHTGVHATSHQLRHRYGTLAYRATGDLVEVARLMGHSSVSTTTVYAQAADDVAARIADAVTR